MAWGVSGYMNVCLGDHETAIRHSASAMRLSPLDPRLWQWAFNTALGHFFAGRYDKAISWAESALRDSAEPRWHNTYDRSKSCARRPCGRSAESYSTIVPARPDDIHFQSQRCTGPFDDWKTSRNTKRACEGRGCRSNRRQHLRMPEFDDQPQTSGFSSTSVTTRRSPLSLMPADFSSASRASA